MKDKQVTVSYNAIINATIRVPSDWDENKIKEELKDGYGRYRLDDEPYTDVLDMIELIVDGEVVKL